MEVIGDGCIHYMGQYNLGGKRQIRSITSEAQQVTREVGNMCSKCRKNLYDIAFLSWHLNLSREKRRGKEF